MDLVRNWESVGAEFRERADKSRAANPELCRALAVGLEQCARELRLAIGVPPSEPPPNPDAEPCPDTSPIGGAP